MEISDFIKSDVDDPSIDGYIKIILKKDTGITYAVNFADIISYTSDVEGC
jgi:hypothetical protein